MAKTDKPESEEQPADIDTLPADNLAVDMKPDSVEVMTMPVEPDGYVINTPAGKFALVRLFLENIVTKQKREQCVPVNMSEHDWPYLRDAEGKRVERRWKAPQRENYTLEVRNLILSQHGYSGGFDPQRARDLQLQKQYGEAASPQAARQRYPGAVV